MARNGAGVYTLPGTYLAVTGETLTATQHNAPLTDIETALNDTKVIAQGGTGAITAAAARTSLDVPGLTSANTFAGAQTLSSTLSVTGAADFTADSTFDGDVRVGTSGLDAPMNGTVALGVGTSVPASVTWTAGAATKMIVANNGSTELTMLCAAANLSSINFADPTTEDVCQLSCSVATGSMRQVINNVVITNTYDDGILVTGLVSANTISGPWVASQAEAEAGVATDQVMTPLRTAQAITAQALGYTRWATIFADGVFAVNDSGGVSSVVDNGTGDHTVNFTTNFSDVNYTCLITLERGTTTNQKQSNGQYQNKLVGSCDIATILVPSGSGNTFIDADEVSCTFYNAA